MQFYLDEIHDKALYERPLIARRWAVQGKMSLSPAAPRVCDLSARQAVSRQ